MRAKKSLGQHFLKSERALSTIIESAQIKIGDTILEIGPGTGTLTEKLLATSCQLTAVEKDDDLYELLKEKFQKEILSGQLNLIHDDILNFQTSNLQTYKLVANIPYNITGTILKKFLEADQQPEMIVLLVQKEVARRIVARKKPLDSARGKESILSISIKVYGQPRFVETVKAGSFVPMPQVDSGIIVIESISKDFFKEIAVYVDTECQRVAEGFFKMVRAGFQSKRKKLSSNLSVIFNKNKIRETFERLGLDEFMRAENMSVDNWQKLAKNLL